MAFIPAPAGTFRVVVRQSLKGQEVVNVLHYLATPPADADHMEAFLTDFVAEWTSGTGILAYQNQDLELIDVTITDVSQENGLQRSIAVGLPGAGGSTADPIANVLAAVVGWRSGVAGRNGRGRMYVAGITDTLVEAQDQNRLTAAAAANLQAAATELKTINSVVGGTDRLHELQVTSYYDGTNPTTGKPIPRVLAVNFKVENVVVGTLLGTQRRRRPEA